MTIEQEEFEDCVNRAREVMNKTKYVNKAEFRFVIGNDQTPTIEYKIEEDAIPDEKIIMIEKGDNN